MLHGVVSVSNVAHLCVSPSCSFGCVHVLPIAQMNGVAWVVSSVGTELVPFKGLENDMLIRPSVLAQHYATHTMLGFSKCTTTVHGDHG